VTQEADEKANWNPGVVPLRSRNRVLLEQRTGPSAAVTSARNLAIPAY